MTDRDTIPGTFPRPAGAGTTALASWRRMVGRSWRQHKAKQVPMQVLARRYGETPQEIEAIGKSFEQARDAA